MSTPSKRRPTRHKPTTRPATAIPLPAAAPPQHLQHYKAIQALYRVLAAVDFLPPRNVFKYMRSRGYTERHTSTAAAVLGLPLNWHLSDAVDLDMVLASFHADVRHGAGVSEK